MLVNPFSIFPSIVEIHLISTHNKGYCRVFVHRKRKRLDSFILVHLCDMWQGIDLKMTSLQHNKQLMLDVLIVF